MHPGEDAVCFRRPEVARLLGEDFVCRRRREWPLLDLEGPLPPASPRVPFSHPEAVCTTRPVRKLVSLFFLFCFRFFSSLLFSSFYTPLLRLSLPCTAQVRAVQRFTNAKQRLHARFPFLQAVLDAADGHVVLAGGSVLAELTRKGADERQVADQFRLFDDGNRRHWRDKTDADFFFYGLGEKQAGATLDRCISALVAAAAGRPGIHWVKVHRQAFVTTVSIRTDRFMYQLIDEYQFIHRVYPTKGSIIGGFDIAFAAVLFDGENVLGTPLAAWSIINSVLLIDVSRRSTSFKYRVTKYHRRYGVSVCFPGVPGSALQPLSDTEIADRRQRIKAFAYELGMKFSLGYDYESPRRLDDVLYASQWRVIGEWQVSSSGLRSSRVTPGSTKSHLEVSSDYGALPFDEEMVGKSNGCALRNSRLDQVKTLLCEHSEPVKPATVHAELQGTGIIRTDFDSYATAAEAFLMRRWGENSYGLWCAPKRLAVAFFAERFQDARKFATMRPPDIRKEELLVFTAVLQVRAAEHLRSVKDLLARTNWITQDPGRQWTSSINPVVGNVKEYYGPRCIAPLQIGISPEIETLLRLARRSPGSEFSKLSRDLFDTILENVARIGWEWEKK